MEKKSFLGIKLLVLFSVFGLIACGPSTNTKKKEIDYTTWQYTEKTSKIDKTTIRIATVLSLNSVHIPYPDVNEVYAMLSIAELNGVFIIDFIVTKGFIFGEKNEHYIRVKFDNDDKIYKFPYKQDNKNPETITILDADTPLFVEKVKTAKTLVVEIPFLETSRREFEFNVAGLNFESKGLPTYRGY